MASGGDLIDVNWQHPNLGQGTFYFKAGEDSTLKLGGFVSADEDNNIDGSGRRIDKKTRSVPFVKGTVALYMDEGTLEDLLALQSNPVGATYTFTWVNGHVYRLQDAFPVGDLEGNANESTMDLKIAGSNTAKKIT